MGATCHEVIGLVLRHGVALIVGGLAIGFADAAVVTQVAQRALLKFVWVFRKVGGQDPFGPLDVVA